MQTTTKAKQKKTQTIARQRLVNNLPIMLSTTTYTPTALQLKTFAVFIQAGGEVSPNKALESLGSNDQNWYKWNQNPDFVKWWREATAEQMKNAVLPQVHKAIANRALQSSDAAAKLFLERFDTDYKPVTKQELTADIDLNRPDALELSRIKLNKLLTDNQSNTDIDITTDKT